MLKIRLQRIGKKKQAYFRVVIIEHTRKPKGRYLELLGSYDPHRNHLKLDRERIKYWLSIGAKTSGTVNNLLVSHQIIDGKKVKVWQAKKSKKLEGREVLPKSAKEPVEPTETNLETSPETNTAKNQEENTREQEEKIMEVLAG